MTRNCPKCDERPVDIRIGYCRECKSAINAAYRKSNLEYFAEAQKRWRKDNPGHSTVTSKLWRQTNPELYKQYRTQWHEKNPTKQAEYQRKYLLKRYGLTGEQFQSLLEKQRFKCVVCEDDLTTTRKTNIDHCHSTGSVRGILCFGCNVALGLLKDDPVRIKRLAAYIIRARKIQ